MNIRKGKLKDFRGSWNSGLGMVVIEDSETGIVEEVPCDNGATVRALESCFGNVIGEAHCVKSNEEVGFYDREVYWSKDDTDIILAGFTPIEEASEELEALYVEERV